MAILTDSKARELATNARNYTLPRLGHLNRIPSTFKADTERFLTGRAIGAIVATLLEGDPETPREIGNAVAACLPEVRRHIQKGIAEAVGEFNRKNYDWYCQYCHHPFRGPEDCAHCPQCGEDDELVLMEKDREAPG